MFRHLVSILFTVFLTLNTPKALADANGHRYLHGLLSDGTAFSLDVDTGRLQSSGAPPSAGLILAKSACVLDRQRLIAVTANQGGSLALTAFDLSGENHEKLLLNLTAIGFSAPGFPESVREGLDWYLQRQEDHSTFLVGGDALEFAHVMKCNFSATQVSWDDLLQYGEGAMLAASQSTYDHINGHLWLQTVFDVSASGSGENPKFATYLKQYDVATASLVNLPSDVTNAAVLVAHDGLIWSVGVCGNTSVYQKVSPRRCLWSLDGTKDDPAFARVMELGSEWGDVMPGMAGVLDGVLVFVLQKNGEVDISSSGPPLNCTTSGVCHRVGDGTTFEEDGWHVVEIDLAKHNMSATKIEMSAGIDRSKSPVCGVPGT